ncbi:hypothetical protein HMPREF0367_00122 [[Eubacterium] cylindroides ATCC 27803]|uniref:Uncharacterized protein n=1 Tax=Faecalitalea cylindroides ATCC 27803 TaxID=649755 RepID=U2R1A1_9FIRM|nr:hypothetical protein HMPREF0367_00122 [[Eubacterium] cylindroides ATCC 27803] [Faecalitalea cylindroides ATCC 27803]
MKHWLFLLFMFCSFISLIPIFSIFLCLAFQLGLSHIGIDFYTF